MMLIDTVNIQLLTDVVSEKSSCLKLGLKTYNLLKRNSSFIYTKQQLVKDFISKGKLMSKQQYSLRCFNQWRCSTVLSIIETISKFWLYACKCQCLIAQRPGILWSGQFLPGVLAGPKGDKGDRGQPGPPGQILSSKGR